MWTLTSQPRQLLQAVAQQWLTKAREQHKMNGRLERMTLICHTLAWRKAEFRGQQIFLDQNEADIERISVYLLIQGCLSGHLVAPHHRISLVKFEPRFNIAHKSSLRGHHCGACSKIDQNRLFSHNNSSVQGPVHVMSLFMTAFHCTPDWSFVCVNLCSVFSIISWWRINEQLRMSFHHQENIDFLQWGVAALAGLSCAWSIAAWVHPLICQPQCEWIGFKERQAKFSWLLK